MSFALPTHRSVQRLVRLVVLALVAATLSLGIGAGSTATAASPQAKPTTPRPDARIQGIDPAAPVDSVIKGLVYDQEGKPLDDIQVEAFSSADPGADPVASDLTYEYEDSASHGAYELHVPAGEYLVRFSSPDFADTVYDTVFHGGGAGTAVTVGSEDTVTLADAVLSLDTGTPVTGTVLDAQGKPLSGADVSLVRMYADGDYSYIDDALTDATGHYTFEGVNHGRAYTVVASYWDDNDGEEWVELPSTFLGQQPVAELADRFTLPLATALAPITLRAGTPVTGHVTGPSDQPVQWADVAIYAVGPDGSLYSAGWTQTEEDGAFTGDVLGGATYTIGTDGGEDDQTYLGNVTDPSNALTFTLGTTAYDVGTIQVGVTGSLVSVAVVDGDGDPSDEYDVRIWRKKGAAFTRVGWASSRQSGTYQRRLDWDSQYTFEVVSNGESVVFLGGATSIEDAQLVTPTQANPTLAAGTITVPGQTPGKLRGAVVSAGKPLAGAEVVLYGRYADCDEPDEGDCWDWITDGTSGATGQYQFRLRPWLQEDYSLFTVAAELEDLGYERTFAGDVTDVAGATTYGAPEAGTHTDVATITLTSAPYTVLGTYVVEGAEHGEDAEAKASLYCWDGDGSWDQVASTWTSSGRYALRAEAAYDACLVQVDYYDYDSDVAWHGASVVGDWPTEDVTGVPGVFAVTAEPTSVPTVSLRPPASISGTITAYDAKPFESGNVFDVDLYRWDADGAGWEDVDSEGSDGPSYSFQDVDPGTYATRVSYYSWVYDETPYADSWSGPGGMPAGPGAPGTVTITGESSAETLDVVLRAKPVIRGTVVDGDGPVAGAQVKLYGSWCDDCGANYLATATTDENGGYTFPLKDSYRYNYEGLTARAMKPSVGYTSTWLGDVTDSDEATVVPMADGEDTVLGPITLSLKPGTVVGTLTTYDGGSLAGSSTYFELFRWDAAAGSFGYVTGIFSDDDEPFTFTGLEPGTYTVSAEHRSDDGVNRYAKTFYGGRMATSADDAGKVFTVGGTNPTKIALELGHGVGLSGVVSTPGDGGALPVEGVTVTVFATSATVGSVSASSTSDADGRYQVRLPADTVVDTVYAYPYDGRFETTSVGAYGIPVVVMDGTDRTYDLSVEPQWQAIGTVAGEQDPSCLTHTGSEIEYDGHTLQVGDGTVVVSDDDYTSSPLSGDNSVPALAPLSNSGQWASATWGIDDGTLCVQWGASYSDSPVYQALVTPAAGGGYDVVYNYDQVSSSRAATRAGYSDGQRSFGTSVVFPGIGNGYRDSADTALTKHSLGSEVPGRYAFHFAGFAQPAGDAPYSWASIKGVRAPGSTLTASAARWYLDSDDETVAPEDVELRYRWHRGATELGTGTTYVVQPSDFGLNVRVDVDARVAGHRIGHATTRVRITQGSLAATNVDAPALSPDNPAIGATITLDPGTWTPAEGLTEEDLSFDYVWYRDGSRLWDASGTTYVPGDADAGRDITARVLVEAPGRGQASAQTAPVTVAQLPKLAAQTQPAIVGATKVGQTLTVDPGTWGEAAPLAGLLGGAPSAVSGVTFDYTWYVGWRQRAADAGSGGTAYTLKSSDLNQTVTVAVTAHGPGYRDGTASSTVGPVLAADAVTRVLTVHVVDADDDAPVSGAYVYACEDVDWTCLPAGTTDGAGVYAATALADRDYSVSVYPGEPYRSASRNVQVADAADVTIELTKPAPPPANVSIPTSNGTYDGVPVVHWQQEQDFNVTGCAATSPASYTVKFSDGTADRTGTLTKGSVSGGIATFHATIPAFYPSHGDITIETNVPADCEPGTEPTRINVYIDPSGIVTDQYGQGIEDASVTLLRSDNAGGPYVAVPNGSDIMSPENRANPSTTDDTGFFRWDVTEGWYRVKAEASGCTTATTDAMEVPPIRVDLLIKLQCAAATAPSATPAITGTGVVGSTLSTSSAVWADPLDQVTIQWLRNGVAIEGADDESYQVGPADSGKEITVRQTARRSPYTQEAGHGAPVSFASVDATSAAKQIVGEPAPVASTPAGITGTPKVGSTLSSTAPTWNLGGVANALEWYADGVATGVTATSFPLGAGQVGKRITVVYTGTLAGHLNGTSTSAYVDVVKGDAPTASAVPSISGTPKVGQSLTASSGTWPAPGLTFGYQWQRAGAPIGGATSSTYAVTTADVGKAITVTVVATRAGYQDGTATSAAVTVVKRVSTVTIAAPKKATSGKNATVTGTITVTGVAGPLGAVTLFDGKKKVGTVTLKATAKGKVSFVLKKLKAGTHQLKLVYGGTADTTGATSKVVKLKVTKAKKSKKGKHRFALPRLASLF